MGVVGKKVGESEYLEKSQICFKKKPKMYSRPGYMSGCRTYAMVTPPSSESENRSKNVPLCFSSNICSAKGLEIKPMTNPFCHSLLKCCCVSRRIR